ncbi:MAG: hypothetical protein WCJ47_01015 [Methanomicrobiales archaeon]
MVNTDGQLYTIEGIAAGLIMLMTAYIVVNSTSVYTLGDTHISDMQLEVLGSDALNLMNTAPNSTPGKSPLQTIVETDDAETFMSMFLTLLNNRAGSNRDHIEYVANVTDVDVGGAVSSTVLSDSMRPFVSGEHAVRVSDWVIVEKRFPDCSAQSCSGKHAVLVEVLLWRD